MTDLLDAPAMAPATIDADAEFASWAAVPASTPVATIEEAPAPAVIQEPQSIPERVLALAALQPGVNPEMFDRLVAWQEREQARQAEEAFNAAMNAAQAEIMPVARTAENSQTKSFYAKLEAVDAAIRPIYLRHGFNVAYGTVPPLVPGNIRVECEVSLGRHSKKYYREAPADTLGPKGSAVKTVLHGGGSTETYLKRYAVCGAFNVVFRDQDDDGERGGKKFIGPEECARLRRGITKAGEKEEAFIEDATGGRAHRAEEVTEKEYGLLLNTLTDLIREREQTA